MQLPPQQPIFDGRWNFDVDSTLNQRIETLKTVVAWNAINWLGVCRNFEDMIIIKLNRAQIKSAHSLDISKIQTWSLWDNNIGIVVWRIRFTYKLIPCQPSLIISEIWKHYMKFDALLFFTFRSLSRGAGQKSIPNCIPYDSVQLPEIVDTNVSHQPFYSLF